MNLIKTEKEIALLRVGGKRLALVLAAVAKAAKPGVSGSDLEKLACELITQNGDEPSFLNYKPAGESKPFPAALCVSINDEIVHGIPSDRVFKKGDIVGLDLGLNHQRLFTDHAVTVAVGEIAKETQALLEATKEALMVGIKAARPGNTIGDIGAAIEAVAKRNDYGIVRVLGGHGVGKRVHEEPHIPNFGKKGTGLKLKAGMVLAVEPMFTLGTDDVNFNPDGYAVTTTDGSLAAHFEHTIVITETGAEILTKI